MASISLPRGHAELRDQLRRYATSIALNIGEGASKEGPDARRYFAIARGSCGEVAATLLVVLARGMVKLLPMLNAVVIGLVTGVRSLRGTERRTEQMARKNQI